MLEFLLFKKFERFNESSSFSKAARMSSTYFRQNLALLRLYSFNHLGLQKLVKILARAETKL